MATTKTKAKPKAEPKKLPVPASCVGLMNKQQVCDALAGIHPRTLARMVRDEEFPKPERLRGKPVWKVVTVNEYVARFGVPVHAGNVQTSV